MESKSKRSTKGKSEKKTTNNKGVKRKEPEKQKVKVTASKEEEDEVEEVETKKPKLARSLTDTLVQKSVASTDKEWNRKATNLKELDFHYNDEGKLVNIKTGKPFQFIDQEHYELIGDFVVREIQDKMVKEQNMKEIWLPLEAKATDPRVNIFLSDDALTNKHAVVVIICGTGAVRAGQWARSLCINDSLETGSMIPYIQKAKKEKMGVIVVNPNFTSCKGPKKSSKKEEKTGKEEYERIPIAGLETPFKHIHYVWDKFINHTVSKHLLIVAHSFGGVLATALLSDKDIFEGRKQKPTRLRAIAFTDSVHSSNPNWSHRVKRFMDENAINYAQSSEPLLTKMRKKNGCPHVSAGTNIHERTSSSCMKPLWEFLLNKIEDEN